MSDTMIPVPESCACAQCGRPVDPLTSYGLSTPVDSALQPVDFCGLYCAGYWINGTIAKVNRQSQARGPR